MARLYNVIEFQSNKLLIHEETATEIADKLGCEPGKIRNAAEMHYLIKKKYLINDTFKEKTVDDELKKQWDDMCMAAAMIRTGKGKIKMVLVNGKLVYRTVRI